MNGWDIEVHVIHRSVRPELQPFDSFAATMFSKEAIGSFFAIFGDVDGYVRTSEKKKDFLLLVYWEDIDNNMQHSTINIEIHEIL